MSSKRLERRTDAKNGVVRLVFVAIASIIQIAFLYFLIAWINKFSVLLRFLTQVAAVIVVLVIYGRHKTSSMKMPWLVIISVLPLLGIILWNLMESEAATGPMRRRFAAIDQRLLLFRVQREEDRRELLAQWPVSCGVASYLWNNGRFPVCRAEDTRFFGDTRDALEAQLQDLERAEKFIFMEYYAIEDKEAFGRIREVLRRKVKEGVEVRLFFDDIGSIAFIEGGSFAKSLQADGVQTRVFNKVMPSLRIFMNNRDHHKIMVVDGKVAYTGGYNLADEYFNLTHPYGEWSDAGIRVSGPAVHTFTTIFLEMWNAIRESDRDDVEFGRYFPGLTIPEENIELCAQDPSMKETIRVILDQKNAAAEQKDAAVSSEPESEPESESESESEQDSVPVSTHKAEFVQPYADSPLDEQLIGEDVYLTIISGAADYVWFVSPYLILTDEMSRTLTLAAERGVDVRIVTPGIPDKKKAYQLTRSYYAQLVRRGVRIYEFRPGFCHDKICVSDDRISTCGTVNLDYRSFYHHFEDGCVMYGERMAREVRGKIEWLMSRSEEVTERYREGQSSMPMRIYRCILRLFAPLM